MVEPSLANLPRIDGERGVQDHEPALVGRQQLAEVGDDDVGSVRAQLRGVRGIEPVDTDHVTELPGSTGFHTSQRILEYRRLGGLDLGAARAGQESVRCGLAW